MYWGCPNISEFFDTSYWVDVTNSIIFDYSKEHYENNIEKINKNCEIAKQYCENIIERIILCIVTLLNKYKKNSHYMDMI